MGKRRNLIVGGAFVVFVLVPSIVLFSVSFSSLDATEYGLDYNNNNKQVDTKVYTSGLYFLGLGHSFIKYPRMLQTIEFESSDKFVQAFSSDGLPVSLGLSFQYKLTPDQLHDLYMSFGENYLDVYLDVARSKIGQLCTNFTAYQFFNNQSDVASDILKGLQGLFASGLHCTIEYFQLHSVKLPAQFEDAIQDTIVAEQGIIKAQYEYNTAVVNATTQVINCENTANITVINAKAEAAKYLQIQQATATATAHLLQAEGLGLSTVQTQLNFTADLVNTYAWLGAIAMHEEAELYLGLNPQQVLEVDT
jgi:regulator of protease activity HflC (stomatin/prohibitin superfamily)